MAKLNLGKIRKKAEEIKAKEARKGSGGGDSIFFSRFPVGTVEIRLLPPWSDAGELAKEIFTHFKLPPGGTTVVDIEKSYPNLGVPNPVAEVLERFKDHLDVSRLWSKATPKVNVYFPDSDINRDCTDLDDSVIGTVKVVSPPIGVYNSIVKMIANPRIGDVTDPYDGQFITVEKTVGQKWQDTKYTALPVGGGPLHDDEDEIERILAKTHDLDKINPAPDDAKIAEIHTVARALEKHLEKQMRELGLSAQLNKMKRAAEATVVEEEEEEVETPSPKSRSRRRRKPTDEEEEEESPFADEQEEESEEEAPPPPKKVVKKAKKKVSRKKKQPECFGDSDVFKIDEDQVEACNKCMWEIPCKKEQQKSGTYSYVE